MKPEGFPRVSVVIPAYNAGSFLREAIDSVLAQSWPVAEIIVVDDGSTDNSREIARAYCPTVRLLETARGGASGARNAGAREATGEWLAFLDADDIWLPNKLERQFSVIDDRTALVYCDRWNIGVRAGLPEIQSEIQPLQDGDLFTSLLLDGNVITTSGVLIRTAVFHDVGGFDEDPRLIPAEDWDLWVRVAASHVIRACREPLIQYRLHAEGMSRRLDQMNDARCFVIVRALSSQRGRALPQLVRRRIWSETWRVNGWDATRHGSLSKAMSAYARSAAYWPFTGAAWSGMARVILRRA